MTDKNKTAKNRDDNDGMVRGDQESIVRAEATDGLKDEMSGADRKGGDTTSAAVSGYRAAREEADNNPNAGISVDSSSAPVNKAAKAPVGKVEYTLGEQPPGHEMQADQEMRRNVAPDTELEEMERNFSSLVAGYKRQVREGVDVTETPTIDVDKVRELAKRSIAN